ncbi:hypothetical protein [Gloeobacter kilaueensis]|uniref:Uncharacterized protein n=1 Tax=Gloeobacter kilaueensis (strain ATCC BAA-2537 / CCAP 1431/1 / ULC 316 / JS1) TaxID=1183438 RepID=U5QMV7_GLOK1|nr:hypothetical protein [Gloeobacter kilaueensis]AGY60256.1 hypothetical protein GKIL_4010 [Gloeobacter kilaueensis JS1]
MPSRVIRPGGSGSEDEIFFDMHTPLHLVRLWSNCPHCGQRSTWYRLGNRVWELCPGHGVARQMRSAF